jgi:serine protease Do
VAVARIKIDRLIPMVLGNSGGPLVNLNGEAVGMNTFIVGPAGGNIGMGFAIPINSPREVANQLIRTGAAERGYLGLIAQNLTTEPAEAFGVKGTKGAVRSQITEDSAAADRQVVWGGTAAPGPPGRS